MNASSRGVLVAIGIIGLWLASLAACLELGARSIHPALLVVLVLARTFLTSGLFITAHDAMHRAVSKNRFVNDALGATASFLFAAMSYARLRRNHALHHGAPTEATDPDYSSAGYLGWLGRFLFRYATWYQIGTMAVLYNVLHLRYDDASLWAFWAGPALLASVQLFTFGTYLPHRPSHRGEDRGAHRARSQRRGHVLAMLSCWFFGYHHEHHAAPGVPWYRLWREKERATT
ncbi:fatty acid desaturase [soil metagenome]